MAMAFFDARGRMASRRPDHDTANHRVPNRPRKLPDFMSVHDRSRCLLPLHRLQAMVADPRQKARVRAMRVGPPCFVSLFADGVSNSLLAAVAHMFVMFGEARKNLAVAHLNITAIRFDVGLALLREVVNRN